MNVFYCPDKGYLGDVIPFFDTDGRYKPFYLKLMRDPTGVEPEFSWYMLTTDDHLHFTEHKCNIVGGTGSVIKVGDVYHMFYCKFEKQYDPMKQWVHHAVSYDGMETWEELLDEAFEADDNIYEITDFRDPFVFWNEEEQNYWMLIAAQAKGQTKRKGCVGLLKSTDLVHWDFCGPFYSPRTNTSALECPDLFKIGSWYYLIYSSYTDRFQTVYRMSKSLNGPWITPPVDTFDTRAYYAAKTGTDGKDRYLYAWNPTRNYDEWKFNPKTYMGDDYNTWDWGGNLVIHKLTQQADGTLTVSPIENVVNSFTKKEPTEAKGLTGDWEATDKGFKIDTPHAFSALKCNKIPELCHIEMDICFNSPIRQLGIALQINDDFDMGYYLILEPFRQRVQFKTGIRMFEDGGKMFPYEIEMERPLSMVQGEKIHVDLYIQDSILIAYFNNKVALSTRMFNYRDRNFGIFASEGNAAFENISLYIQEQGQV